MITIFKKGYVMNYSKQREIIIEYIKSVKTHPTAEMIYNELRVNNPGISLGTVYRNLDKLSNAGEILRLKQFGDKDRFDGNTNQHYHGCCIKCLKLFDIYLDYFSSIDKKVEKDCSCNVVSHEIKFNVICPECK